LKQGSSSGCMVDVKISGKCYSDEVNVIDRLYAPCLKWAKTYVRDAGYFSSHVYKAMSKEILDFILRSKANHITLITCIDINPADFDAMISDNSKSEDQVIAELQQMLADPVLADPVKMLAALVASKQMTIFVSLRKTSAKTPYSNDHSKSGYFTDGQKTVAFDGSINETYPAIVRGLGDGNKEHFNIYSKDEIGKESWEMYGEPIIQRLNQDCKGPFPYPAGKGTIVVKIDSIKKEQLPSIDDHEWAPENHKKRASKRSAELYEIFENKIEKKTEQDSEINGIAVSKKKILLRDHQKKGLKAWDKNDNRGILRHATGSGKTITALTAIREHAEKGLPVVILVPSRLLLEQWVEEVEGFIPEANILPVGSGYSDWKKYLGIWTDEEVYEGRIRVTIAIMASARTPTFLRLISNLKNGLLIVDECHRIGAKSFKEICDWKPSRVLGLSATPERSDDGFEQMKTLCGEVIHEYNLEDAILDGYLTKYIYNVETVNLSLKEEDDYKILKDEISESLRKFMEKGKVNFKKVPGWLKLKLIQAKRIIKKASEKTSVCGEIIQKNYDPREKQNWLVYCEDSQQLNLIRGELEARGISPIFEYWSGAKGAVLGSQDDPKQLEFDRSGTIAAWEREGGIMLSIQCLDEGVNIPSISHGIILASSNNPRQFIQRRGRMLRLSEGKNLAYIWDTLVVPSTQLAEETNSFLLSEVKRGHSFAKNSFAGNAKGKLISLIHEYGIRDEAFEFEDESVLE
jgi:superfamily II DNA or RNA helicase